jgi:hypothetical protein
MSPELRRMTVNNPPRAARYPRELPGAKRCSYQRNGESSNTLATTLMSPGS